MRENFTVWSSKYALAGGVKQVEVRASNMEAEWVTPVDGWVSLKMGRDAHKTEVEACAAAETKRAAKIASLRKQITKLEKLTFDPTKAEGRTP